MITVTAQQVAALARVAAAHPGVLQLHQVGEDPDLFVTTSGGREPDFLLRPDGEEHRCAPLGASGRSAGSG